jgi:DNA-binding NarL/FixJ family response regulator/tRNA A-37 threonylcarbamoyl transferase component Bud32
LAAVKYWKHEQGKTFGANGRRITYEEDMSEPITILIAEDQAITRFGLKCALECFPDLKVVAESADGISAVLQALAVKPNVILMDIGLPKVDGIKASKQIKDALPGVRIIMFTSSDDEENIYAALSAGADGYCLKNVAGEHLYSAIKAVTMGVAWLDPGIADRVLRSRGQHEKLAEKRTVSQKIVSGTDITGDQTLNENQMLILQLLSQGADLENVALKFNLTADSVAKMVNETIAKLHASAGTTPAPSLLDLERARRTVIGDRYSVDGVLGRGGMGIVYKGTHLLMERPVAIKMLHPEYASDELVCRRFQTEAKSLSLLSHPNLVAVYDFGITAGNEPFMVMDYHKGLGLEDILDNHEPMTTQQAIDIFCQVCDALTAVHNRDIIHRDIKPSNIVISEDGNVKLVDFGIAKSVDANAMNLTMAGEVVGTPKYMSPEQCMGLALDQRSDIYALGCVMYEVFTGRAPFSADSFYEMVRQHVDKEPSRVPFLHSPMTVPAELQKIVLTALSKDPDTRHQTAADLKQALLQVKCSSPATPAARVGQVV